MQRDLASGTIPSADKEEEYSLSMAACSHNNTFSPQLSLEDTSLMTFKQKKLQFQPSTDLLRAINPKETNTFPQLGLVKGRQVKNVAVTLQCT